MGLPAQLESDSKACRGNSAANGIISNYSRATSRPLGGESAASRVYGCFSATCHRIKMRGAPQKGDVIWPMTIFPRPQPVWGVNARVIFCTALAHLYPVEAYNATDERVGGGPGIETRLLKLIEVRAEEQLAIFRGQLRKVSRPSKKAIHFRPLACVPPMSALNVMAAKVPWPSRTGGWVDVNRLTCQHKRFAMCSPSVM